MGTRFASASGIIADSQLLKFELQSENGAAVGVEPVALAAEELELAPGREIQIRVEGRVPRIVKTHVEAHGARRQPGVDAEARILDAATIAQLTAVVEQQQVSGGREPQVV